MPPSRRTNNRAETEKKEEKEENDVDDSDDSFDENDEHSDDDSSDDDDDESLSSVDENDNEPLRDDKRDDKRDANDAAEHAVGYDDERDASGVPLSAADDIEAPPTPPLPQKLSKRSSSRRRTSQRRSERRETVAAAAAVRFAGLRFFCRCLLLLFLLTKYKMISLFVCLFRVLFFVYIYLQPATSNSKRRRPRVAFGSAREVTDANNIFVNFSTVMIYFDLSLGYV